MGLSHFCIGLHHSSCPVFDLTEGFSVRRSAEFVIRRKNVRPIKLGDLKSPYWYDSI